MIKTIFSSKDSTLYQSSQSANTGNDSILQLSKFVSSSFGDLAVTRPVVHFDTTTVSASLAANGITTASSAGGLQWWLKLFISEERDTQTEYQVVIHPIRESWTKGSGKSTHLPLSSYGVSWQYRDGTVPGTQWTGVLGGRFFSGSAASESITQAFNNVQGDIEVNVTDMVHAWHNNQVTNNGFILKRSGSQETDSTIYGDQFYYSRNTNTIYSPRLEARYDDASHTFTATQGTKITVSHEVDIQPRLRPEYKQNSQERIWINTFIKGGARSQAGSVGSTYRHHLPQSSSYAIVDNATGEYVYKHDKDATYVGRTGTTENYIDIDMNGLFPERYYALEFKINHYSGSNVIATRYYKSNTLFKVVK
jgi:hypothetical protein